MGIIGAVMVPHPPIILPEIGRGEERKIRRTTDAYEKAADFIVSLDPETIIISSPHSVMYADYFHISPERHAEGNFAQFRAPQVRIQKDYDTKLVSRICRIADRRKFPAGTLGEKNPGLDHGTMIPLYFIDRAYERAGIAPHYKIVRIGLSGLSLKEHYRLGMLVRESVEQTGCRAVWVASGDLSHKCRADGPYGFDPAGPEYDRRIMDVMGSGAFDRLFDFDEGFCEKAAECGHRSFVMMAGALDAVRVQAQKLSHEDIFGIGYGVCIFRIAGMEPSASDPNEGRVSGSGTEPGWELPASGSDQGRISMDGTKPGGESSASDPDRGQISGTAEKQNSMQRGIPVRSALEVWEERHKKEIAEKYAKQDPYVSLARRTLEIYITEHRTISPEEAKRVIERAAGSEKPEKSGRKAFLKELERQRAGVFVSIHEDGQLRGCIGTISATCPSVAEEIIQNAISAGVRDPRFPAIRADELDNLEYSVDVLGRAEEVSSESQLDVKRYGVIVTKGARRGLLLPNLDGVDTVADQIRIAKQKAGLLPDEKGCRLQRFEVVRHY